VSGYSTTYVIPSGTILNGEFTSVMLSTTYAASFAALYKGCIR
jgi:hypothetical protein